MINNAIEERAERLLLDSKTFIVPTDLEKCTEFLKISMHPIELEDKISGFLAIKGKTAQIGYNTSHGENRKRFTIAHEIGHYILHAQSEPIFIDKADDSKFSYIFRDDNSSSGEYRKEREANNFAAALLMPKKLLLEEIEKSTDSENILFLSSELANKFKVSPQAMGIRLSHLGYFDYENISM